MIVNLPASSIPSIPGILMSVNTMSMSVSRSISSAFVALSAGTVLYS